MQMPSKAPTLDRLTRYDANWYQKIAERGYTRLSELASNAMQEANWAFFPLFPLTAKALPFPFAVSAALINNLAFIIAAAVLYNLFRLRASAKTAETGFMLFIFCPYSFYYSVPYSESLYMLLTLLAFYLAAAGKWKQLVFIAPFVSAARNLGVFLVFPLGMLAWSQFGPKAIFTFKKETRAAWAALFALPAGLFAYMAYLHYLTGDALSFVHVQQAWNRLPVSEGVKRLLPNMLKPAGIREFYNGFFVFLGLFGAGLLAKKRYYPEAVWLLLSFMLAALTGTFNSMARFVMAGCFASIFMLALLLRQTVSSKRAYTVVYCCWAMGLGFLTLAWILGGSLA